MPRKIVEYQTLAVSNRSLLEALRELDIAMETSIEAGFEPLGSITVVQTTGYQLVHQVVRYEEISCEL